jgi:hypothetical protein
MLCVPIASSAANYFYVDGNGVGIGTNSPLAPLDIAGDVYGETPLSEDTLQHLDAAYVERAEKDVALQLSRAGIRLAAVLNKALGRQVADKPR